MYVHTYLRMVNSEQALITKFYELTKPVYIILLLYYYYIYYLKFAVCYTYVATAAT